MVCTSSTIFMINNNNSLLSIFIMYIVVIPIFSCLKCMNGLLLRVPDFLLQIVSFYALSYIVILNIYFQVSTEHIEGTAYTSHLSAKLRICDECLWRAPFDDNTTTSHSSHFVIIRNHYHNHVIKSATVGTCHGPRDSIRKMAV